MWFSKKDEKKSEIEKIKQALEREESLRDPTEVHDIVEDAPSVNLVKDSYPHQTPSAPLFIKLDKYDQIVSKVENINQLIESIREVVKVLDEIKKVKEEAEKLMEKYLAEVSRLSSLLSRDLVKPTVETYGEKPIEKDFEKETLEEHLEKLKRELEEIKRQFS